MQSSLPENLIKIENNLKSLTRTRSIYSFLSIAALIAVIYSGLIVAETGNATSIWVGLPKFFDYPVDLFVGSWEYGYRWNLLLLEYLPDLISTINMALFSTAMGTLLAFFLSIFSSRNLIKSKTTVLIFRRIMDICRSFPELVIALVLLYLLGKSALPAVIAIIIHTAGALGKLFSEAIENVDKNPIEGLESCGASWFTRIRFGVVTQALPLFLTYTILRFEINIRASTILGFVGAGGIGEQLYTNIQWKYEADTIAIMFLLVSTIITLDYLSSYWRKSLIGLKS